MRRVLFSDLHGNDLALDRLLHAEAGTVISVGDVLGRAGSNQKCLERMRERGIPSVQGNHEMRMLKAYQSGLEDWAANWVRTWPLEFLDADALVTHTLFENHDFFDIELPEHVIKLLERRPLVFTGHQHLPGFWTWEQGSEPFWTAVRSPVVVKRRAEVSYLIQVGSLGEPLAEALPRYLSWDGDQIEWHSLPKEGSPGNWTN